MFDWMKRKVPFAGSVLYRGTSPMRPEEFGFLTKAGIRLSETPSPPTCHWSLMMDHPKWGQAKLSCPRHEAEYPLQLIIDYSLTLTESEKMAARAHGMQMIVEAEGNKANLLRDRKDGLRFLHAVMADDGLAAADYLSMGMWSRAALDEELSHDADLDIEHIYAIHAVTEEKRAEPYWVHTHGLAEVGFFDFDIMEPHESFWLNAADMFRRIAFAVVEKKVNSSTDNFVVFRPHGVARFVEAEKFNAQADRKYAAMRASGDPPEHNRKHAVLCDPEGNGLLGLFSRGKVRPARAFSKEIKGEILIDFSTEASGLMGERARNTYGALRRIAAEFAAVGFPILVKLGYVVDGGGDNDKEHLWFSVNELLDDEIDGTLENQPYYIARMKQGDRGRHPVALISDWMIMTPMGPINPRSSRIVRSLRENPELLDRMRAAMREFKQQSAEGDSA